MLNLMRKHAGSWMIKFILGAVILAFIPFGYGIYQDRRDAEVATVNGEPIRFEALTRQYNNLLDQVRNNFGGSLNEETIKGLRLKEQALNQLIDQKLMLAEAAKLNFSVSNEELVDSIGRIEAFQTAGVFDPQRYEYVLSRVRLTQEAFEDEQQSALLIDKLRNFVLSSVKVSDAEALEWYRWNNAEIDIRFVKFNANSYQGIDPTEEEVRSYFDAHKDNYKTEVELKARYLRIPPESFEKQVVISEDDIQVYYDGNPDEYQTPKTVEARHILIKVDSEADEQTVTKTRQKAEEILKQSRSGKDFAELAKKHSEGPTAPNGGHLGSFRKEAMVKPFSDQAFSMKAGDISDPVRTRFGWHIIKVEKVNEETTVTIDAARDDIRRKLTDERARTLAYDMAELIYDNSFEGEDLVRNAADNKFSIHETGYFTRKGPDKDIKDRVKFATAAFNLAVGDISAIQDFSDGYYILQITDKKEARHPDFADVATKVRVDLIKEMQNEKAREEAQAFLLTLKNGQSMADETAKLGLAVGSTGFFKRNAPLPKIGYDQKLMSAAFMLSEQNRWPDEVFEVNKDVYVIEFGGRKVPAESEFETEKANAKQGLLQQKQIRVVGDWIADVRKTSDITIEDSFLN
jgi:peptidyl-prolyl cis-trans isomerase D